MSLNLQVVTAPQLEALTLEDVKRHVRVELDSTDQDDYLREQIVIATRVAQEMTDRALLTQTLALRLDRFYSRGALTGPAGEIYLPMPPLQSVTSIVYLDTAGVSQTLAAEKYQVVGARADPDDKAPDGYVRPAYRLFWPTTYPVPECVTITYVAGWTSAEKVRATIKGDMLTLIANRYAYRESILVGETVAQIAADLALFRNDRCDREYDY